MKQYLELLDKILKEGEHRDDRTGVGTRAIFGYQMRFDMRKYLPIVTTKRVHLKSVIHELLWMLKGKTNNEYLKERGVTIWNEWAREDGDLGPIYGAQWREFSATGTVATICTKKGKIKTGEVLRCGMYYDEDERAKFSMTESADQIRRVFESLKTNPTSRRHLVVAWNPLQLPQMALPPCHCLFQFYLNNNEELSCQLYQRSCDAFLGLPFNITSYAILTAIFADCLGVKPGEFVWTGGDVHIYENHIEQVKLQLSRTPYPQQAFIQFGRQHEYPWDYEFEDITVYNYKYHPAIKAPVAV